MTIQPGFYGILSKPVVGYPELAAIMVAEGVQTLQLRMKGVPTSVVLDVARQVRAVIPPGRMFIVNDSPELALAAGADGVHLGQDDAQLAHARRVLGPTAVVGLSTHSVEQVRAANALDPSYIGIGPVFATTTKPDAEPVIGLEGLADMCAASSVPTVAIGGIRRERLTEVLGAGARGFCVVGAVNMARNPAPLIRALLTASERRG